MSESAEPMRAEPTAERILDARPPAAIEALDERELYDEQQELIREMRRALDARDARRADDRTDD